MAISTTPDLVSPPPPSRSRVGRRLDPARLDADPFSLAIYGDPDAEVEAEAAGLLESIREHGVLVPLVVSPAPGGRWNVVSGHRRLACARILGLRKVPCEVRTLATDFERQRAVLEYNRHRRKTFSQMMREADALETIWAQEARERRLANLQPRPRRGPEKPEYADRRNSDDRNSQDTPAAPPPRLRGRTDAAIAEQVGLGGKDLYRQARAIWRQAQDGDVRARSGVAQLDAGTKTIHAAYKDLRRRDRYASDFRPTPYDVWSFRHDRAFGIPHPGAIPARIVAHTLHYFSPPDGLVVDPMAGGGTTLDVCQSMGRRCLAYDLHPTRPEIQRHDVRHGLPPEAADCDLIFCDPPYHTMLAGRYPGETVAEAPLADWLAFLQSLARSAIASLRPGGFLALLLAPQTEKDLPAGFGYLDHVFFGYSAALRAGFLPERRISCPMDGAYLPQQVRRARQEGRLLGQVRDLLVLRKPSRTRDIPNSQTGVSTDISSWLPF
jgi:hypothetical protein